VGTRTGRVKKLGQRLLKRVARVVNFISQIWPA
jgi:hypothetical protein